MWHTFFTLWLQCHWWNPLKRYLQSSHCFADSCELKWTTVWLFMLDKPGMFATPIVHYICGVFVPQIRTNYFNDFFKLTICKNLDPLALYGLTIVVTWRGPEYRKSLLEEICPDVGKQGRRWFCVFLFCRGQTFCWWPVVQVDGHLQRGASKYVQSNMVTWW